MTTEPAATTSPAAQQAALRERRALRLSIAVSLLFTVIALAWGLTARSQVMLLDAIFTPLGLVGTWGALVISRIVAKGPTRRFPFGRDALIPMFVIAQATLMFAALGYAVFEAIRVILLGGSAVGGLTLLLYGFFGAAVAVITWWQLRRMSANLALVEAEAAGWLSATASSVVIVLGATFLLIITGTSLAWLAPYTDSVLVIVTSVGLLVIPLGLVRTSIRELQMPLPDDAVTARVHEVIAQVCAAESLAEPVVRIGVQGHMLNVELGFLLPVGTGDIATEDRVRLALLDGLADLPFELWLLVGFTHDPRLLD